MGLLKKINRRDSSGSNNSDGEASPRASKRTKTLFKNLFTKSSNHMKVEHQDEGDEVAETPTTPVSETSETPVDSTETTQQATPATPSEETPTTPTTAPETEDPPAPAKETPTEETPTPTTEDPAVPSEEPQDAPATPSSIGEENTGSSEEEAAPLISPRVQTIPLKGESEFWGTKKVPVSVLVRVGQFIDEPRQVASLVLVDSVWKQAAESPEIWNKWVDVLCQEHEITLPARLEGLPPKTVYGELVLKIAQEKIEEEPSAPATPSTPSGTSSSTANSTFSIQDFYAVPLAEIKYEEPDDTEAHVVWEKTQEGGEEHISSATLVKLVEALTHHKRFDRHFGNTFIVTYRMFTTAPVLMEKLAERFNMPPPPNMSDEEFMDWKKNKLDKVRLRITQTLKTWMESFYAYDFDEELKAKLDEFVVLMDKTKGAEALARMIKGTKQKMEEPDDSGKVAATFVFPPSLFPKKKVFGKQTPDIMKWPQEEVARQITLMEFKMFQAIQPKEFLNQNWNKEHRDERAPNIFALISWFNLLSRWAGTRVVSEKDIKKRVKYLEYFIDLSQYLFDLKNFNGLFAVLSGLTLAGVHRLKRTWAAVPEDKMKQYEELSRLKNRQRNFGNIREKIKESSPPYLPYIGLYLTDLTFIDEGASKHIEHRINFSKCALFAEKIRDLQTIQNSRFLYKEVPELQDLLRTVDTIDDDTMWKLSNEYEPKEPPAPKKN